jgi:uncharacterized membrane protein YhhN
MKKQFWIIAFLVILLIELIGVQIGNMTLQYIAKPLLLLPLAGYFLSQTGGVSNNLKRWVLLALFFCWLGDVLLLFQVQKPDFFLFGLAAFLLAHIFYILFFHGVRIREKVKGNILLLVIVVVYYTALIVFLSPYLKDMTLPVRVYGIVISFMFMLAMHMLFIKNKTAGKWMMVGALLFVISDSTLAIDKFYKPFELAGVIIMITYGAAQFFIVKGAAYYISSAKMK